MLESNYKTDLSIVIPFSDQFFIKEDFRLENLVYHAIKKPPVRF